MDLGSSGNNCFFTDTLFRDSNTNGVYDQSEGISGVSITLVAGDAVHGSFDISTAVGSFAIPIQSIAASSLVQVVLSNTSAASITMSVPRDYHTYTAFALAPGEGRVYGTFSKPATVRNLSLRELTPIQPRIVPPQLAIAPTGTGILLTWHSEAGVLYLPQRTTNLLVWTNLATGYQPGTGSSMTWQDSAAAGGNRSFYRLLAVWP